MLAVVDRGILAVAVAHLVVIVPYSLFRVEVANRVIGTTWRQSIVAMRPGLVATVGLLAIGLPVRLMMPEGLPALVAITVAGGLGAVAGLWVGARDFFGEIVDLAGKAIGRT